MVFNTTLNNISDISWNLIPKYFFNRPNTLKLWSLFIKKKPETIRKLCKLIDIINNKISSPWKNQSYLCWYLYHLYVTFNFFFIIWIQCTPIILQPLKPAVKCIAYNILLNELCNLNIHCRHYIYITNYMVLLITLFSKPMLQSERVQINTK
jgi:hypothetical protein